MWLACCFCFAAEAPSQRSRCDAFRTGWSHMKHPIGATFTSKWCSLANDLADPDLWKRTVAHLALQRLFMEAHEKIEDLQKSLADLNIDVERDLVAADLQVIALEELMKTSPSPEREDVPLCEERRTWSGRTKKALPPAPPLGPMPNGSFRSTVDSWNRKRDRLRIEKKTGLPEEGDDVTVFFNEHDESAVIAIGYRRVLYGDHGPYLEFTKHQIHWEAFPVVLPNKPSHAYYDERFTEDKNVKAYEQRKTVRDKPNPPPGEWSANNDRFDIGYADYQPGYIYISADCLGVRGVPNRPLRPKAAVDTVGISTGAATAASTILKAKAKVKARPVQWQPTKPTKPKKPTRPTRPTATRQRRTRLTQVQKVIVKVAPVSRPRPTSKQNIMRSSEVKRPAQVSITKGWKPGSRERLPSQSAIFAQAAHSSRAAKRRSCSTANRSEPKGFWVWVEE